MKGPRRKILFIEPPFYRLFKTTYSDERLPLGAAYLAAVVRRETAWKPRVWNADFAGPSEYKSIAHISGAGFERYLALLENSSGLWGEVSAQVLAEAPDVVGISVRSANVASALKVAAGVKAARPQGYVVMGGPHASVQAAELVKHRAVDFVVRGEGEVTLIELLGAIDRGRGFNGVAGLTWSSNGKIVENPARQPINDLDSLPFPNDAVDVLIDRERYPVAAFRYMLATRGCSNRCVFCGSAGVWGGQARRRSPDRVADELEARRRMGVRRVHFVDDTFGLDRDHLKELCRVFLERRTGVTWSCTTHARLLTEETVEMMKRAGCRSVEIGVESGSDELLSAMRKGLTVAEAEAACRIVRRAGLETVALFMAGFPGETEEMLTETLAAMRRIPCDQLHFGFFTPYPGSEGFERCREGGLVDEGHEPWLYFHQSPKSAGLSSVDPVRFRELTSAMWTLADRRNRLARVGAMARGETLERIAEGGLGAVTRKALRFFLGW